MGQFNYYYAKFYESDLEAIAMDFMADQKMGYEYQSGSELHRAPEDVVLENDLKGYLRSRYKDLSANELESIVRKVKSSGNTLYETNREFLSILSDGFIQRRDDPSKKRPLHSADQLRATRGEHLPCGEPAGG